LVFRPSQDRSGEQAQAMRAFLLAMRPRVRFAGRALQFERTSVSIADRDLRGARCAALRARLTYQVSESASQQERALAWALLAKNESCARSEHQRLPRLQSTMTNRVKPAPENLNHIDGVSQCD